LVLCPVLIDANFPFLLYFSLCVVVRRGDRVASKIPEHKRDRWWGLGFFKIYLWLPILRAESFRDAHSLLIALAQDNLQYVYTEASARLLTTALRQI
jgi:hypothetical protein